MMTLIIGGSGSGKSEFAENYLVEKSTCQRIYIATMQPYDAECVARIEKHRAMRAGKNFSTIECYTHLEQLQLCGKQIFSENAGDSCQMPPKYDILLECISNLCANEMYAREGRHDQAADMIVTGICQLAVRASNLVIVSNDVFSDGRQYDASTRQYLQCLGEINRRLARLADEVIEVTAGCPFFYKAKKPLS